MTDVNTSDVIIRPYEPRDRNTVRRIACDTANAGRPIETFFSEAPRGEPRGIFAEPCEAKDAILSCHSSFGATEDPPCGKPQGFLAKKGDRELAADLLTVYYTDFEPESAWMADQNGRVAGYLTGCRDTARFIRCMVWRIAPQAFQRAIARGIIKDQSFRRLVRHNIVIWLQTLFQRRVSLATYPGHLHLNLDPAFRGQQIGSQLAIQCLEQFVKWHVRGIHASVREDNAGALRFLEGLGFVRLCRHPFLRTEDGVLHSIVLGKKLIP